MDQKVTSRLHVKKTLHESNSRKDGYLNRPAGTFATIEYPGANTIDSTTKALDLNASGLIVGQYQLTTLSNGDTIWHGFIVSGVQ